MDSYAVKHVAKLFDISQQTVGVWAKEFEQYLSPTANPGKRKKRLFSFEDMAVFSLVSSMQGQGKIFADIHMSLKAGVRGEVPDFSPDELGDIVSGGAETRLKIEVERMQHSLLDARQALKQAEQDLKRLRQVEDENVRLSSELEQTKAQLQSTRNELQTQVNELLNRVERLSKEAGREYAKGFVDGMKEEGGRKGDSE